MTNQTAEQATEILARELYVRHVTVGTAMNDHQARNEWYVAAAPEVQERFLLQAQFLEGSLAQSGLALTWAAK